MRSKWFNLVLGAFLAGAVVLGVLSVGKPKAAKAQVATATVQRGVVTASVSGTGNVIPGTDLALNFQSTGKVTEIDVSPGQHVTAGQVLARIDSTNAQSSLQSAQSALTVAQDKLQQLINVVTPAQKSQDQLSLVQAQNAVNQAQQSLAATQAQISLDAVLQQTALSQAQQGLSNAQANAALDATQQQTAVNQATAQLNTDQTAENAVSGDQSAVSADQSAVSADQSAISADGCNGASPKASCSSDQARLTSDQSKLSSDQSKLSSDQAAGNRVPQDQNSVTNADNAQKASAVKDAQSIQGAQNALTNAQNNATATQLKDNQSLTSAQNALGNAQLSQQSAEAGNAVKEQPPLPGDLAAAQAAVTQAESTVNLDQIALSDTALLAPTAGTVAAVNGSVGQSSGGASSSSSSSSSSASATSGFVHLSNVDALLVKVGFTESDASQIKVGQPATITLAALPAQQLAAHVVSIDTLSTVVSNVVNYNVTLALDRSTAGTKPGMTASVTLVIGEADNALHVPTAAVRGSGANGIVTVVNSTGQQTQTPVVLGLKGDNSTQIVSGLNEGQTVVIASTTGTSGATTGARAGAAGFGGGLGGLGGGGGAVRVGGG